MHSPLTKTLWISSNILAEMKALVIESGKLETGGLLMGYVGANGEPVVTEIVGPGKEAEHHTYKFCPDQAFHESEINRIYHASKHMTIYLGDWHSHPAGGTRLSSKDKATLKRMGKASTPAGHQPFMLILANNNQTWCTGAFQNIKALFNFKKTIQLQVKTF